MVEVQDLTDQFAAKVQREFGTNTVGSEEVVLSCRHHKVEWRGTHSDFVKGRLYSRWWLIHRDPQCGPERRREAEK